MSFKNRIIEYGVKPADQFLAHPQNARIHPKFQREAMRAALNTVGFVAPVLEAKSGYLVDGHERIWQALQNDNALVPYVKLDIDENEEAFILATFDPLTALADYDKPLLKELLGNVDSDDIAIQQLLSQLAINEQIFPDVDWNEEWAGMPEFEQSEVKPHHSIIVHFESEMALIDFGALISQNVTTKTKYIYYPRQQKVMRKGRYLAVDENES